MAMGLAQGMAEMLRLARVDASGGNLVSRFMERHLEGSELEFREELPTSWSMVEMALFIRGFRTKAAANEMSSARTGCGGCTGKVLGISVFPWKSTKSVSYLVKVGAVKGRLHDQQEVLAEVADYLGPIEDMAWGCKQEAESLHEQWRSGRSKEVIWEWMAKFDRVVAGIYTEAESLPEGWLELAGVLNEQANVVMKERNLGFKGGG